MHAPAMGLIAASACHRTALTQRAAVSGLPPGAPGTAGSVSLQRDALVRRREALLALRSQACAAREAMPSLGLIESALAPLLASIVERKAANGGGNAPPPAAPPPLVLWEVSAALQGALQDEAQGPEHDAPTLGAPTEGAEGAAATAAAAPRRPPPGLSGAAAEGGDAPSCELRAQLTNLHAQLAAARRELIARLCCRLQRGWEELDSIDTRLIVLVTSQAAQALIASAPLAAPAPTGTAGAAGAAGAAGVAADAAGVGGVGSAGGVGVGGVSGMVSSGGAAGAAEAMHSTAQAAASSVVAAGESSLLEEASNAWLVRVRVGD